MYERINRLSFFHIHSIDNGDNNGMHRNFLVSQHLSGSLTFLYDQYGIADSGVDRIECENVATDGTSITVDGLCDENFMASQVFIFLRRYEGSGNSAKDHTSYASRISCRNCSINCCARSVVRPSAMMRTIGSVLAFRKWTHASAKSIFIPSSELMFPLPECFC